MPSGTKVSTEKLSPSAFMRQLRPELYSDTIDRTTYQLDASTLGYHLETITARNQTHDFEIFCRAMRGAPARAIQELAGHQDLGTTQRYMHLSSAAVDAAIRLLETGTEISRVAVEK